MGYSELFCSILVVEMFGRVEPITCLVGKGQTRASADHNMHYIRYISINALLICCPQDLFSAMMTPRDTLMDGPETRPTGWAARLADSSNMFWSEENQ